jgi:hypothetical protein
MLIYKRRSKYLRNSYEFSQRKNSPSNEPICKDEKAEFLIAQELLMIALIAISFFPLE